MSEEVWDSQVDYNLKSVFLTCKHALPHMVAAQRGAELHAGRTRWDANRILAAIYKGA